MTAPGRVASRTTGHLAFTAAEAAAAVRRVDASGNTARIEATLPTSGRPRQLNARTLLVGLDLLAGSGQPSYLNRLPGLLNHLPASTRFELGLTRSVTYRQVRTLFGHLVAALDGSPSYGGKKLGQDERAAADARLQEFVDHVVAASLPADDAYTATGDLAVDATILPANSRPESTQKRKLIRAAVRRARSTGDPTALADLLLQDQALAEALGVPAFGADPDGHREALLTAKRHARRAADRDAATLVYKGKLVHGYAAFFAVDIPTRAQVAARLAREADEADAARTGRAPTVPEPEPVPLLIRRMRLEKATAAQAVVGSELLSTLPTSAPGRRNRWQPGDVVADRGFSHGQPCNWHTPLRAAGYRLIHDLHPSRRGHTASADGVVIIDGQPYSPGILDYPDLVRVPTPAIGASHAAQTEFQRVIELRRPFLLPFHGRPDLTSSAVRVSCPALRGALGCPLRGTLDLTRTKDVPEVFTPPTAPRPAICTQRTVRLPAAVLAHAQDCDLLYGSKDWYDAFTRRRPLVEATNGIVKNPTGGHLGAMRLRVRGRAAYSVLVAFVVAAHNVAALEAWQTRLTLTRRHNALAAAARRSRKPAHRARATARPAAAGGPRAPAA